MRYWLGLIRLHGSKCFSHSAGWLVATSFVVDMSHVWDVLVVWQSNVLYEIVMSALV